MAEPLDQLKDTLKSHGFSLTQARLDIFAALLDKEPQSLQQIVAACPAIDRTSVYRVIKLYERLGIIQRLQIGWKYKLELSDAFHHHHHHLSCQRCGKIIDLPEDAELERRLRLLAEAQDFSMQGHQLEIQGYCSDCRAT